jgi:hypothetical protein
MADGSDRSKKERMTELPPWAQTGQKVYLKGDYRQREVVGVVHPPLRNFDIGGFDFQVYLDSGGVAEVRDLEKP